MKINYILLLITFTAWACNCFGQTLATADINEEEVTELQCIQNGDNVWVTALMDNNAINGDKSLSIYRSIDNGLTWDSVFTYGSDSLFKSCVDPVITCDNAGVFYVVSMRYNSTSNPGAFNSNLWLFKSTDDGLTWMHNSSPYTGSNIADYPQLLAADNNSLFLSYTEYTPDTSFINFIYSLDGGTTWSSPVSFSAQPVLTATYYCLGSDLNYSFNHKICLSYGDYNIGQIYFTSSTDSGLTWQAPQAITINPTADFLITKVVSNPFFNHLGIISHKPHLTSTAIYYSSSTNGGSTWQTQSIATNAALAEGVIDNSGNVHVTFNEESVGDFHLNYRYSLDSGNTFSPVITLLNLPFTTSSAGEYQSLVLGNDNLLHLTFIDWDDNAKAKHLIFAPTLTAFAEITTESAAPKVFPNPVHDVMHITFETNNENSRFELTNLNGKIVLQNQLENHETTLNINALESGFYLLKIYNGNNIYIQKVVKE